MTILSGAIWLATGGTWAIRSLMAFADPDYWNPVTALDWSSVWLYSVGWLLMAPAVLLIGRLVPTRPVLIGAVIVAIGAVLAGGSNALEDGFGMRSLGTAYVIGVVISWLGLVPLAVALRAAHASRLAGLCLALLVAIPLVNLGGGVIVLAALGALAIRPAWFARQDPRSLATGGRSEGRQGDPVSPPSS